MTLAVAKTRVTKCKAALELLIQGEDVLLAPILLPGGGEKEQQLYLDRRLLHIKQRVNRINMAAAILEKAVEKLENEFNLLDASIQERESTAFQEYRSMADETLLQAHQIKASLADEEIEIDLLTQRGREGRSSTPRRDDQGSPTPPRSNVGEAPTIPLPRLQVPSFSGKS